MAVQRIVVSVKILNIFRWTGFLRLANIIITVMATIPVREPVNSIIITKKNQ